MANTTELYNEWLEKAVKDPDLKTELESVKGKDEEINDRFYRDLEFGTGGLRGVIGAGTNRMNVYTVGKATQGLANYLKNTGKSDLKVAVAYDSRIKSDVFAKHAASIFAANGITANIYTELMPTPMLSWAVRALGCDAGIIVTASHNPAKYNGYKVYGSDGCQVTLEAAEKILGEIEKLNIFADVKSGDFEQFVNEGNNQIQPFEDHEKRLVSETRQRLNVVLDLPQEGLAQREVGDHDGEDREPPDGTAEGHGVPPRAADSARGLLRQQQNVLRRLKNSEIQPKSR